MTIKSETPGGVSSFDQIVADAMAETGSAEQGAEDAPSEDAAPSEDEADPSEKPEEDNPPQDDPKGLESATAALDALSEEELAKIASERFQVDQKAFNALRYKTKKAAEANAAEAKANAATQSALVADKANLERLLAEAREEYGTPIAAKQAYADGDPVAAGLYIEKLFGEDLSAITLKIASGGGAVDPESQKLKAAKAAHAAEVKAYEAKKRDFEQKQASSVAREATVVRLKTEMHHEFVQNEDDAREVLEALEKTWDPQKRSFMKTPTQIADELLAKEAARAKRRGFAPKPAEPQTPVSTKRSAPPPRRLLTKEERELAQQRRFDEAVAGAMKDSRSE